MARSFNGVSQWLDRTLAAPLSLGSLSLGCRFIVPALPLASTQTLIWLGDNSVANIFFELRLTAAGVLEWHANRNGTTSTAVASAPVVAGQWHHGIGIERALNNREVYLDGGNVGAAAAAVPLVANNNVSVARRGGSSPGQYVEGEIGHVALWPDDLPAPSAASLAEGLDPRRVMLATGLACSLYWPLNGQDPERNVMRVAVTENLTLNGYPLRTAEPPGEHHPITAPADLVPPPILPNALATLFDGVDQGVTMGDVLGFDRFDPQTWELWIKTTSNQVEVLIHKRGAAVGWDITKNNTGTIVLSLTKVFVTEDLVVESSFTVIDGIWHKIDIVWTGATGTASDAKMYKDNVEDGALNIVRNNLTGSVSNSAPFMLAIYAGAVQPFDGLLDDVVVHSAALSLAELTEIFHLYTPGQGPNFTLLPTAAALRAWYRMGDDDVAPTLADSSGNGFDGLMLNAPSFVADTPP